MCLMNLVPLFFCVTYHVHIVFFVVSYVFVAPSYARDVLNSLPLFENHIDQHCQHNPNIGQISTIGIT